MKKLAVFLLVVIAVLVAALASGCAVVAPPVDFELTDAERAALSDVINGGER